MQPRTEYALLMLQQIGVPLIRSLASSPESSSDPAKEAALLADLLRRSGEYGVQIEKSLDLAPGEEKSKSLRIALTALGAQTLALQREKTGKTPSDNEAKRIFSALEPILAFSDRYTPDELSIARLRAASAEFALLDGQQLQIQQIMSCLPVIRAVAEFSFGIPEGKLVKEVAERLNAWAAALRERLLGTSLAEDEAKIMDLVFMRMLAALYADCHNAQTKKLMKMDEVTRTSAKGMEAVWPAFEMRANMLETLAGTFLPRKKAEEQKVPPAAEVEINWEQSHPLPPAAEEEVTGSKAASQ